MIGKIIKYMRKTKGLSQFQIAQIINTEQQNISRYESNKRQIPFELIEAIANNCDYDIIFKNRNTKEEITTKNIERKEI